MGVVRSAVAHALIRPGYRVRALPVYPFAFGAETMARVTRREPFLTTDGLRMSKHLMFFSSVKGERELGYKARPYPEALEEILAWFRGKGQPR
ncbi:MAG: hypothetical protein ACRECP_01250 [Methylocella sp.]